MAWYKYKKICILFMSPLVMIAQIYRRYVYYSWLYIGTIKGHMTLAPPSTTILLPVI